MRCILIMTERGRSAGRAEMCLLRIDAGVLLGDNGWIEGRHQCCCSHLQHQDAHQLIAPGTHISKQPKAECMAATEFAKLFQL